MSGLIVFIVIALVLIVLSLGIWKSSMPENDKVLTLILILSVFSLITIIHEAKRPNLSSIKGGYSNVSISSSFFNFKQFEPVNENCSAKVFRELYNEHPLLNQLFNQKSRNESSFILIRPNEDLALSELLHSHTSAQMKARRPVIYIDFKREIFMKENWTNYLGDFHENALLHELWKFREQNRFPWLILENFSLEPEFHDGHLAHLSSLIYEDFAGDVILKPADELTFALLKSDENILRRTVISGLKLDFTSIKLAERITQTCSLEIKPNTLTECKKLIGINQRHLDLLVSKNNSEICHSEIVSISESLKTIHGGEEILRKYFELQSKSGDGFSNKWITYAALRSFNIENLSKKLDILMKENILEMKNGKYKFKYSSHFSAGILAFT